MSMKRYTPPRPAPSKSELWASMTDAQLTTALLMLPEDVRDDAIERAGIYEFMAGMTRRDATLRVLNVVGKPKAGFAASVRTT